MPEFFEIHCVASLAALAATGQESDDTSRGPHILACQFRRGEAMLKGIERNAAYCGPIAIKTKVRSEASGEITQLCLCR